MSKRQLFIWTKTKFLLGSKQRPIQILVMLRPIRGSFLMSTQQDLQGNLGLLICIFASFLMEILFLGILSHAEIQMKLSVCLTLLTNVFIRAPELTRFWLAPTLFQMTQIHSQG